MAIEWQAGYSVGDAAIDAQHQELFDRVNTLLAATGRASLTLAATSLSEYAQEHFTHEEAVMRRISYPEVTAHLEQHDALISKLTFMRRVSSTPDDEIFATVFLCDVFTWQVAAFFDGCVISR